MIFHELETEQVLNCHTIDLLGPAPGELVEGFNDGEACALDATHSGFVPSQVKFSLGKTGEIIGVTQGVTSSFGRQLAIVFRHEGKAEHAEVFFELVDGFVVVHGVSRVVVVLLSYIERSGASTVLSRRAGLRVRCRAPGSGSFLARLSRILAM